MKKIIFFFILCAFSQAKAQQKTENIIIVTTDGFRWQEVFKGMDTAIANNSKYNQGDSAYLYKKYWGDDETERRKKLLPFLWSTVVSNGQVFGNRMAGSKMDVANPYWFSGSLFSVFRNADYYEDNHNYRDNDNV